jgi:hypothetical protein
MTNESNNSKMRNLILVALFITITLFTIFHEGYLGMISPLFWITLAAGFAIAVWLGLKISTIRLVSLLLVIFIIEYIKETIGIRAGFWTYHGINGSYNFGVWAWVLGGVITYALATQVIIKLLRKLKISWPKWLKPIIILLVASIIPLTLGDYQSGTGWMFWLFYGLLLALAIYASIKMEFPVLMGIIIASWIIGNPSEYVGSINSGVWTYPHNPSYPPFFLLFGCWPLEILAQYLLSAYIAKEALDKDTF